METVNHECYVSLEVAKLLKEAGFDWECETCYMGKSKRAYKYNKYFNWNLPRKDFEIEGSDNLFHSFINQKKTNHFVSAPTLDVAQRWLREVKNYEIFVVVKFLADKEYIARVETNISGYSTDIYKFYEEAQEAGIKKALEMILDKEK